MIKEHKKEFKLSKWVIGLAICCLLLTAMTGCKKKTALEAQLPDFYIKAETLVEKEAEISNEYIIERDLIGCNFEANEAYIVAPPSKERIHRIQFVDIDTGKTKRELTLQAGAHESPTDFFEPTFMEYLNGNYYLIDKFHKIVVYDHELKHLFTNMFLKLSYFFDFFEWNNQMRLVLGTKDYGNNYFVSDIEWYDLYKNRRPSRAARLSTFGFSRIDWRVKPGYCSMSYLSPSTCGFEKDGKIYYGDMTLSCYLEYDLKTNKTSKVEMSYLKPKNYTDKDAEKLGHYSISSDGEEDFYRSTKLKVRYIASPNTFYHFGIHDIGKNKIGIIGDLNLKQMKYRLDIIDCISHRYIESIWFPISNDFCYELKDKGGKACYYFNWDKGIRLCADLDIDKDIYFTRISKYKCKAFPATIKR